MNAVKPQSEKTSGILWIEAIGFSLMIAMCWLAEWLRLPHFLFGDVIAPSWRRALLRTALVVIIWAWVHIRTRRLLKRLHHLEEFLRMCGWCRKVCYNGEWMDMETYFRSKFATKTSHGMCPECLRKKKEELVPPEVLPEDIKA